MNLLNITYIVHISICKILFLTENKVHTIHKKFQTDILEYNNGLMCAEFNYQKNYMAS